MKNLKMEQRGMVRVCTGGEMRAIDKEAQDHFHLEPSVLMENAGAAATQAILNRYPNAGMLNEILVFAGKGNNGGDAFVVSRRLLSLGRKVRTFYFDDPTKFSSSVAKNFDALKSIKAKVTKLEGGAELESFLASMSGPVFVVDGILGTGFSGSLEGIYYDVTEIINNHSETVVSLDIPTGVSGDTGEIRGAAVKATMTVSFGFPKLGHFLPPGAGQRGELVNVDISLPHAMKSLGDKFLLNRAALGGMIIERDNYGHKNSFGHTCLIGGSPGRLGAICMASKATHKMGTGLVTVATWSECMGALLAKLPDETMGLPIVLEGPEIDTYIQGLQGFSSVVIGPGLGQRKESKLLLESLLKHYRGPVVIDADGLNLLAEHKLFDHLLGRKSATILTPHPGEMARLLGISKDQVLSDPIASIKQLVELTHSIVLLKGAATLITGPDHKVFLNHYPNDGMATAGSGDVLAGMIGGLVGQNMDPFQATLLGVYLHSLSGGIAGATHGHRSMTAPDIIACIGQAFKDLKGENEKTITKINRVGEDWLL